MSQIDRGVEAAMKVAREAVPELLAGMADSVLVLERVAQDSTSSAAVRRKAARAAADIRKRLKRQLKRLGGLHD